MIERVKLVESIQSLLEPGFTLEEIRRDNYQWTVKIRFMCPLTDIGIERTMYMTRQAMEDLIALQDDRGIVLHGIVQGVVNTIREAYVGEMLSRLRCSAIEPFSMVKDHFIDSNPPPETMVAYREAFNQSPVVIVESQEEMRQYRDRYMQLMEEHGVRKYVAKGSLWW
jgi:hypothetical protein